MSHLTHGTVASVGVYLGLYDMWGPVCQPVFDGHHKGVLEELWKEEQGEQEETSGGQVGATGTPGDGGSLAHHLWQVVIVITLRWFLWRQAKEKKIECECEMCVCLELMITFDLCAVL